MRSERVNVLRIKSATGQFVSRLKRSCKHKQWLYFVTILKESVIAVDPSKWELFTDKPVAIISSFLTGLAACMSSADTHLNCAAANIVSDILDPKGELDGPTSVRYAKIATLVAGIIALVSGLYAPFIYALGTYGYTICGGVMIPAFVIGLLYKDRSSSESRSRMDIRDAQIGITIGIVPAVLFEIVPALYQLLGGGVIPGILGTSLGMLLCNTFMGKHSPAVR